MANQFKNRFIALYNKKKNENYNFFTEQSVFVNGRNYSYLLCNIDLEILKEANNIAKVKSMFTMAKNQANITRDDVTKLKKACQGILAEMFIHFLLVERYGFDVKRYDLERATFEYSTEEYDLKIFVDNYEYEVESRSSNIHNKTVDDFILNDVIIGPYYNRAKPMDALADFHFRPIYIPEFVPFVMENGNYCFNSNMVNGAIKLIITGVATRDEFKNNGFTGSLGQYGTTYHLVNAADVGDIYDMDYKFNSIK